MQQGGTINASPVKPAPQKPTGLAFPSSPFSATTPVQSAILPVTIPISPTKPLPTAGSNHVTTPKTYTPPTATTTLNNGTTSSLKTSLNGVKVPTAVVSTNNVTSPTTVPRTQYPTPFTTPVKVPANLVKTPPTTTQSPARTTTLSSPAKLANGSSTQRITPNTPPLSPASTFSPQKVTSPLNPIQTPTLTPNSPLRTSYSAVTPSSPALSINISPLAKSVPPLTPTDPSKKTHIVSGLVSDLRKQAKNNKRKSDDTNAKPPRVRKKAAKIVVAPLSTTEEQTLLARLQLLGSDTSPAVNRLKRKLTLREAARRNGQEPFDLDARVTKMIESTTKSQQRASNFFSREEISKFTAQLKKRATTPPTPQQPSLQPHTQTPSAIDLFTTNSVPPSSTTSTTTTTTTTTSTVSTPISTTPVSVPISTTRISGPTTPASVPSFPAAPASLTPISITPVSTTPIPNSPPTPTSSISIPASTLPSIAPFASIPPTSTFPARSHTFPTSSFSASVPPAFTSSIPATITSTTSTSTSPLVPTFPLAANSTSFSSTTASTTTTTTTTTSTSTYYTSSSFNEATANPETNTFSTPIIILDDKPPSSSTTNSVNTSTSITTSTTINSINSVNNNNFIVQQQKLQSLAHLKAVKDLPRTVQESPRSFRSLLEGDDLREGLGQPLVSPYTLRTLKPYIWRDYTSKPRHLRLMEELMAHPRIVAGKDPNMEGENPEKFPIDYVYFRPWLLPQVNTFLCSYFWPGIDVRECLEYPDFTVCALYRNLLVGCGFMTPDAYIIYIAVRSGWRDAGIATFMLYHLSQTIKGKDITLHVSATNPAMLLYQKFGFKPEEFIVDFYNKYYPDDSLECKHAYLLRLRR